MKPINGYKYLIIILLIFCSIFIISCSTLIVAKATSATSAETPFTGLEIQGLSHVWQNNRWEYVDPNDSLVAGYWNDKEGKYEHTADILKGEWEGLFVSQSFKEIEKSFKDDSYWTAPNWENGTIKIPIPFDITKGGIIEQRIIPMIRKKSLLIKKLPDGTFILAPFPTQKVGSSRSPSDNSFNGYALIKGEISVSFITPLAEEQVGPELPPFDIKTGDLLVKISSENYFSFNTLSNFFAPNFLLEGPYQLMVDGATPSGQNFSFNNFLKDEGGRFIYLSE